METDKVDVLPALKILELKKRVAITTNLDKEKYTPIERSEALESLGVSQYFNGDYSEAVVNLEAAIGPRFLKLKSKKRITLIKSLVSSLT